MPIFKQKAIKIKKKQLNVWLLFVKFPINSPSVGRMRSHLSSHLLSDQCRDTNDVTASSKECF